MKQYPVVSIVRHSEGQEDEEYVFHDSFPAMKFVCSLQDMWLAQEERATSLPRDGFMTIDDALLLRNGSSVTERYTITNLVTGEVIADRTPPTKTPVYRLYKDIRWPWWQFWKGL